MPADLLRGDEAFRVGVGDVAQEVGVARHVLEVRARSGVAEERLREEEDHLGGGRMSKIQEMLRSCNLRACGIRGGSGDGGSGTAKGMGVSID